MKMKILSFAPKYYGKKRWPVMALELCSKSQKCVNAAYKKVKIAKVKIAKVKIAEVCKCSVQKSENWDKSNN